MSPPGCPKREILLVPVRARFRGWGFSGKMSSGAGRGVPYPCRCGAYCNGLQVKFTSGVGYQCKMCANVSCTFPDGGSVDSFDFLASLVLSLEFLKPSTPGPVRPACVFEILDPRSRSPHLCF